MKITRLSLWQVGLTSHETYYMADGKTCDTVTTTLCKIETDEGLSGWGEVCPIPHYLPAFAGGVIPAVEELAPVLLGADALGPDALSAECDAHLPDHRYAKSMLNIAFWDLLGRAARLPLYQLLGGRHQGKLPLYHSITCIAPDDMAIIARDAYATGIRQFQVKLGADDNWEADVARLIQVRDAVGSGPLVYGDWNCGCDPLTAIRVGRAVADRDIMLEQPCATIAQCAQVAGKTGLPMKQDETVHDLASMIEAADAGCMQAVALKLSKFGGITKIRQARDLAVQLGARICMECTWGSDVATAASLHLAATTPARFLLNTCDLSGYVYPRVAPTAPVRNKGWIAPPDAPGLGIEVDDVSLGKPLAVFD